jgi:hypothetical protein
MNMATESSALLGLHIVVSLITVCYKGGTLTLEVTMASNEKTSIKVGKIASALLRNPNTSAKVKSIAASVLSQRPDHKKK